MQFIQKRTNVHVAYILSFLGYIYFPSAAWLFFYMRSLTFAEVALLAAIGGMATTLFEIPSGAFADVVGRRTALVISFFLYAVAMVGEAFSSTFLNFAIITVVVSLVSSLYSGSLEALVYDTLKENGEEAEYDKVVSKMESLSWVGLLVSALSGGFMYAIWFRLPFIAQAIVTVLSAFVSLALVEPRIDSQKYKLSDIIVQNIQGFKELFRNTKVAHMSLIFITLESIYYISSALLNISQATEYGLDARGISILFAIGYLISAIISYSYPNIRRLMGNKNVFILSILFLLISLFMTKFVGVMIGCTLIITRIAISTIHTNTRSVILNRHISSKNRATSISTMVLLSHLPYTICAYFIGLYIEKTSASSFAFMLGIILVMILACLIVFSPKSILLVRDSN